MVALPLIKVPISIQGGGTIRPQTEKTEVRSLVTDIIQSMYKMEGQRVNAGDTLLILRTDNLNTKIVFLMHQKEEQESYQADLQMLVQETPKPPLNTSLYQQQYKHYQHRLEEIHNKLKKTENDHIRNKMLFDSAVISAVEYEGYSFQYRSAQNELKIHKENTLSQWNMELLKYSTSLKEIASHIQQAYKEKDFYVVKAPVSGIIEQLRGLYVGSSLRIGEVVAVISPESELIADIYISPKDIGYISTFTQLRIQVDAFNYNQWGMLAGKIEDISSDFMLINNYPMFRVRVSLDKNYLSLQNGIKGYLKKGMNVRARFIVAERSLFSLLYENADAWFNPKQKEL